MNNAMSVGECQPVILKEGLDGGFIAAEIAKVCGIFKGELERFESVIEAEDAKRTGGVAGGA